MNSTMKPGESLQHLVRALVTKAIAGHPPVVAQMILPKIDKLLFLPPTR
jgi:hypothetical protein